MSQSSSLDADFRHKADCPCDNCFFRPCRPGFSYVRVNCQNKVKYFYIAPTTLFVRCDICNLDHATQTHVVETRNGIPVFGTFAFVGGFYNRCRKELIRLGNENEKLRGIQTVADELLRERDKLVGVTEEQKKAIIHYRDVEKFAEERNESLEQEIRKKEAYKSKLNHCFSEIGDLRKALAEATARKSEESTSLVENDVRPKMPVSDSHNEHETIRKELVDAKETLGKWLEQKTDEFTKITQDVSTLQKVSEGNADLLKMAEQALEATKAEFIMKDKQLAEMTEQWDDAKEEAEELQKEVQELKESGVRSKEDKKRLEEYKELMERVLEQLKTKDQEVKRMKEHGSQSDVLALLQKIEKTVERREREQEESLQARVEQLEATLAKKDEEIANSHTTIRQLSECLHAAHKAELSDGEKIVNYSPSPPAVKSRKRRMKRHDDTVSEGKGENSSQNLNSAARASSRHSDASSSDSRSLTLEELQEKFLRLQQRSPMAVNSMDDEKVVKEEIVDEGEDSVERPTPSPEVEKVVERYPIRSKRTRRG